ncbi:MAG: formate dehydrogenase accessory sulfurtransferase FdhD [Nitrospirae bacterium]|nr:formate dehydrogenase accessory sulfurtransferase FdhD [Nitrospirota bacterium]NTW65822.1 formate dehydrogenase accessory sulfurtransferase FdhD [Nitrospirota bacterium]
MSDATAQVSGGRDTGAAAVAPNGERRQQGPEEIPVSVRYNERDAVTLMCSPSELRELAVGWLFAEGFLQSTGEIMSIGACDEMRMVTVTASPDRWDVVSQRRRTLSSGCGGGTSRHPNEEELRRIDGTHDPNCSLLRHMLAHATEYKRTGGIHAAALTDGSRMLFLSEDIGRHNAVDKVIGRGLLAGTSFGSTQLMTTGRISSDIVMKAARAGIPVVISLSVATSLAADLALRAGILLVGRGAQPEPIVYR